MRKSIFIGLVLFASVTSASETINIGRLKKIVIRANGFDGCPQPSSVVRRPDGSALVTVSNNCGCLDSTIQITETLAGKASFEPEVTVKQKLGEFCRPLGLVGSTVLVFKNKDNPPSFALIHLNSKNEKFVVLNFASNVPDQIHDDPSVREESGLSLIPLNRFIQLYTSAR